MASTRLSLQISWLRCYSMPLFTQCCCITPWWSSVTTRRTSATHLRSPTSYTHCMYTQSMASFKLVLSKFALMCTYLGHDRSSNFVLFSCYLLCIFTINVSLSTWLHYAYYSKSRVLLKIAYFQRVLYYYSNALRQDVNLSFSIYFA